ncbi:MAG: hypothetical protein MJE77_22350 [Proteobacteria bacterium]|nr:hypothetical protein [Pseudomonadota bacterium]
MLRILVAVIACCLAVGMASSHVRAQDPAGNVDLEKAREHYRNAETALQSGDPATAATEYEAAYQHSRDPVLFYKIGSAHQQAGNCQRALEYFERYLAEANPDEKFKSMTEQHKAECNAPTGSGDSALPGPGDSALPGPGDSALPGPGDSALPGPGDLPAAGAGGEIPGGAVPDGQTPAQPRSAAEPGQVQAGADQPIPGSTGDAGDKPPTFVEQEPSWQRSVAWISVGMAVALASAGSVLALQASSREEDLENLINFRDTDGNPRDFSGNTSQRYQELIDEGNDLNTYSTIAFAAAGVAAVTAAVFLVLDAFADSGEKLPATSRLLIVPTESSISAGLGWEF